MRAAFTFYPENGNQLLKIPIDFRRHFISFVKTILSNTPFFHRFEIDKPGYSPYVFGVGFGRVIEKDRESDSIIVQPPVTMIFSTGFFDLLADACNGAIALKHRATILGLRLTGVNLLPFRKIRDKEACFRIVGHAVFRGEWDYIDASDQECIEESINTHMQNRLIFFGQQYGEQLPIVSGKVRLTEHSRLRKGVCHHYGGKLTTVQGNLTLSGDPGLLQFIYDFGINVRSGQGFGLTEVI
ncbi:MAG: CRISPR associated protein Cas6 [Pelotomaculum sp. PtaU1.Bin035]|nr:MAG: CRISPR associated protein Cas6 [Pelotomaculum sp. PtaU1.Bin035]